MRVNVGGLEVTVDSVEELDQLIHRFGQNGVADRPAPKSPSQTSNAGANNGGSGNNGNNSVVQDRVVLQHLVDSADAGVLTSALGDMLGRKGKATKPALVQWAMRVHLTGDETNDPFEKSRPGGGRGWRIKPTLMPMAKELLGEMK